MPALFGVDVAWATLAGFLLASFGTLLVGGHLTRVDAWYRRLRKPAYTPPGLLVGAVWWALFTLLGVSVALAWSAGPLDAIAWALLGAFVANLGLNAAWSWLFFRRRDPEAALGELALLWLSTAVLALLAGARLPAAGWMLAPYVAWVAFAGIVNWRIARMNPAVPVRASPG